MPSEDERRQINFLFLTEKCGPVKEGLDPLSPTVTQ